jgi:hypothetical protein
MAKRYVFSSLLLQLFMRICPNLQDIKVYTYPLLLAGTYLAVSQICLVARPNNKNISPGPLSGLEHQNSSTITCLRAVQHDVQRVEGGEGTAPITMFLQGRENTKRIIKPVRGWSVSYSRIFNFRGEPWNLTPVQSKG